MTGVDLTKFDPFSETVQQNPIPWWRAMRAHGPVYHHESSGTYYAVSYDAVDEAVRNPDVYSSRSTAYQRTAPEDARVAAEIDAIRAGGWPEVPALLTQDHPMHRRQRTLINKAFSVRRIRENEPIIKGLVDELAYTLTVERDCDFIQVFAKPLPLRLIASMLSVPEDRIPDLKKWTDNRLANLGNKVDDAAAIRIAKSEVERQRFFAAMLEDRRTHPRDDLLTALVEARLGEDDDVGGEPLSMEELLTMVGMLMSAGNETTTSLLSQTMLHFGRHPDDWKYLRQDPGSRAPLVVEEAVRMFTPTQVMPRISTRNTELSGVRIPAGALVQVVFASANRDAQHFDDPDTFNPLRPNVREHFGFGRGIHLCLGASLARIETTNALTRLAEVIDTFRVSDATPLYYPSFRQRGLRRLNVEVEPA